MSIFHHDHRRQAARCDELLRGLPEPGAASFEVAGGAALLEIRQILWRTGRVADDLSEPLLDALRRQLDGGQVERCRDMLARTFAARGPLRKRRVRAILIGVAAALGIALFVAGLPIGWIVIAVSLALVAGLQAPLIHLLGHLLGLMAYPFVTREGRRLVRALGRLRVSQAEASSDRPARVLGAYEEVWAIVERPRTSALARRLRASYMASLAAWAAAPETHSPEVLVRLLADTRQLITTNRVPAHAEPELGAILASCCAGLKGREEFPTDTDDLLDLLLASGAASFPTYRDVDREIFSTIGEHPRATWERLSRPR